MFESGYFNISFCIRARNVRLCYTKGGVAKADQMHPVSQSGNRFELTHRMMLRHAKTKSEIQNSPATRRMDGGSVQPAMHPEDATQVGRFATQRRRLSGSRDNLSLGRAVRTLRRELMSAETDCLGALSAQKKKKKTHARPELLDVRRASKKGVQKLAPLRSVE
jgi:hypothetical protein